MVFVKMILDHSTVNHGMELVSRKQDAQQNATKLKALCTTSVLGNSAEMMPNAGHGNAENQEMSENALLRVSHLSTLFSLSLEAWSELALLRLQSQFA